MSFPSKHLALAALLLLCVHCDTSGHDIGASNATFFVRPSGIDVELYLGLGSGALLIASDGELVAITPATYPDFSDRLQSVGSTLFALTAGDGAPLNPDAVTVSLSDQGDVLYQLHYPLPIASGTLKIHASYLDKMAEGHVGSIYVMTAAGDRLGFGEVRADSQDVLARLPAADALVKLGSTPEAAAVPAPPTGGTRHGTPWLLWGILAATALLIAAAAVRGIARQNMEGKIGGDDDASLIL